ncbi:MAG TPA: acetyl-CoA C-acyltransferase, partial [Candidimonas sp.]|nr:acetyl-CoA C-acyltransferase [Candidimonas sp.]
MREAVIVSTARTPLTKAHRGEFNITPGPTLAAFAVRAAVERAGIDPALIEDAILGCGYPEGTTGRNVARQAIIRSGLPISIGGATVNRFCASGLQAIAIAAGRIIVDGAPAMIAGGVESISHIRTREHGDSNLDPWIVTHKSDLYLSMIETADIVAARYGIGREAQDRFSAESQRKTEAAQLAGRYSDEIVPCATIMAVADKETGAISKREVMVDSD